MKGDEESTSELGVSLTDVRVGVEVGVKEEVRIGQDEGKSYPPSSIEGELEILSIMSSSILSSLSPSVCSPSSAEPEWSPFCCIPS